MKKRKHTYGRLTEENVDEYLQDLMLENKGDYITQSVAFSKTDKKQMQLLRMALIESRSFGAYVRELLSNAYAGTSPATPIQRQPQATRQEPTPERARIAEGRKSSFYSK